VLPASARRIKKGLEERKGEDGRNPTLRNMGELIPAKKSRCWRQNLKMAAKKTQTPLQDEEK
jgi:hypothetical protein